MNAAMEDPVLTALRNFMQRELDAQREKYTTRAARFRVSAAEAHRDWRLGCIPPRWGDASAMIFRECMSDIIRLRLRVAYMPLFQGLERIERRFGVLANLKREPWASKNHPVNRA